MNAMLWISGEWPRVEMYSIFLEAQLYMSDEMRIGLLSYFMVETC